MSRERINDQGIYCYVLLHFYNFTISGAERGGEQRMNALGSGSDY